MAHSFEKMLLGNVCIGISTIFWGVNYAFTKALVPVWMSANAVSATRLIGGCILFWLASLFCKTEKMEWDSLWRIAVGGTIGLFGCIFLFVLSLDYGSAIDIAIIMTMPPIFVIMLEVLFMRRRPSWLEYAGIIISFVGAPLVILARSHGAESGGNYLLGDCLAVISALCFAIYLVILTKPTAKYRPITLLRWVFLFAALPALFLAPAFFNMPLLSAQSPVPWLEIGFILVGPTFLAYLLVQPAIKDIGSVLVSLYQYLTPVIAALSAILMGLDRLRWQQVAAMLIIVAGMILTNIGKKRETRRQG